MTLENLKKYAEGMGNTYPDLEDKIRDVYFLAEMEVKAQVLSSSTGYLRTKSRNTHRPTICTLQLEMV